MGRGACVLLGEHLRQNAVAQAHRRITEARQLVAFQQFGKDVRAGHDDLRPARTDALHAHALIVCHPGELFGELADAQRGRDGRLFTGALFFDEMAGFRQRRCGAGRGDDGQDLHRFDPALGAAQFAGDELLQAGDVFLRRRV